MEGSSAGRMPVRPRWLALAVAAGLTEYEAVQERLVEAWGFLRRMPDREAGWIREPGASGIYQRGQLSRQELWAQYKVDSDDYDRDQRPTLPGLRSHEVDRMWEALGWIDAVVEPRDRKLLGVVLGQLSRDNARPAWVSAAKAIGWDITVIDGKGNATGAYDVPATSYVVVLDKAGKVVKEFKGTEPWVMISNFRVKIDGCVGQSFIRSYAVLTRSTDESEAVLAWYGTTKVV